MVSTRNIEVLRDVKQAIREPYAWPGGYPKYIIMSDGGALSVDAARQEFRSICWSTLNDARDGWQAAAVDINWEDPELYCDHTGKRIESAYAEPEDSKAD